MNLIWKRPDGYHGALPSDFTVVRVGDHSNLWLHRSDRDTFPFRISGGWEEEAQSKRLNNLINLLSDDDQAWLSNLRQGFAHSMKDHPRDYCKELTSWIDELKSLVKGGNWEVEIITKSLDAVRERIVRIEPTFVSEHPT
jgi:hypothetical protein